MKVDKPQMQTPAEIRAAASAWYEAQVALAAAKHGTAWPEHRDWVEAYLREELRERLIALGWRPRNG